MQKKEGEGAAYRQVESLQMFGIPEGEPCRLIQNPGIPMALFASSLEAMFPAGTRSNAAVGQVLEAEHTLNSFFLYTAL